MSRSDPGERPDQGAAEESGPGTQAPGELDLGFLREDLGFQVHQARRAVRKALRGQREVLDKPPPGGSLTALILIGLNPGASQNELAEATHLDPSKVNYLVGQLQQRGWLDKRASATDRRRQDLYLTSSGEQVLDKIRAGSAQRLEALGGGLTGKERRQLLALLLKFQASVSRS